MNPTTNGSDTFKGLPVHYTYPDFKCPWRVYFSTIHFSQKVVPKYFDCYVILQIAFIGLAVNPWIHIQAANPV